MTHGQTTVYLDDDVRQFLREHKAIAEKSQKETLNESVRLMALLSDPDRLERHFPPSVVEAVEILLSHPARLETLLSRIKRR